MNVRLVSAVIVALALLCGPLSSIALGAELVQPVLTPQSPIPDGLTGDFNNDGYDDVVAQYNYGGTTTGMWVFLSNGSDTLTPTRWWLDRGYDANRSQIVVGDYNNDGLDDVAAQYDYGGTTTGLWLFLSNGVDKFTSVRCWLGRAYNAKNSRILAGDFNGDGKDDIAAQYDYGGTITGIWVFQSEGYGTFAAPSRWWLDTQYNAKNSRITAGDLNRDGKDEIVAQYDYGGTTTGMWVFRSPGLATLTARRWWLDTQYNAKNSRITTGDFDGDGKDDLAAQYDYGRTTTGMWFFHSNGADTLTPHRWWLDTQYNAKSSRITAGDFNKDGVDDIGAQYDYGGTTTGMWIFSSDGVGTLTPFRWWLGRSYNAVSSTIG